MKNILRSLVDLISVMVHPLTRLLSRNKIRILLYHRVCNLPETGDVMSTLSVPPENFSGQMALLTKRGFTVITLEDFIDYKEKNIKPPTKTVVITFDDGYRDNYLNALPILEKFNFRGTFFIVTDYVDSSSFFPWLDIGETSRMHAQENREYWQPLRREEILDMNKRGACFGSHSKSHCSLVGSNENSAMEELKGSKEYLEALLHKEVKFFCYPYGDMNNTIKNWVQKAGYLAAVTTRVGGNSLKSDFLELRRIPIGRNDSPTKYMRKVEGDYDWWFGWVLPLVIFITRRRREE